jgi:L-amino acid N-acyltransferase YncA
MTAIFRHATIDDLPAIARICNQAIKAGDANAFTEPLHVEDLKNWFNDHHPDSFPIYIIQSAMVVIGWGALSPYRKERKGFRFTAEISFYIDYDYHAKGFGKALINFILNDCTRVEVTNVVAIMLDINPPSEAILRQFGFEKWGHLPGIVNLNGKICGQFIYGRKI